MKKSIAGASLAVCAIALIAGLLIVNKQDSNQPATHTDSDMNMTQTNKPSTTLNEANTQATSQVEIKDFDFVQKKITVKKGTTVTWTNQDSVKHDIMPDTESPDFKASELLGKGESYSFTFNTVGTYSYHCSPHPYMKASVEVTE